MHLSAIQERKPNQTSEITLPVPDYPSCAGPGQEDRLSDSADNDPSQLVLELDRLAALDHQDALEKHFLGPDSDILDLYTSRLATMFTTAARLLDRDDHDRQALKLAVQPHAVRLLSLAHKSQAQSANSESVRSIHQDHATQLRRLLHTGGSRGNIHTEADAI